MEANVSPTIRDDDLRNAFELYNKQQSGLSIYQRGHQSINTKIVRKERSGVLGNILDYLIGKKTQRKVYTTRENECSYLEVKLVTLIESVKNEVEQNKIEEVEKDAGRS